MTEQLPIFQKRAVSTPKDTCPLPGLLVSSEEVGWEGIMVRAYHEPAAFEGIASGARDSALVLILSTYSQG